MTTADTANPPPRPAIPRPELAPERAPVTLRSVRHWRRHIAGTGFFLGIGVWNLVDGLPVLALIAALIAVVVAHPILPGIGDLRLDRDGFMWRGLLWWTHRFRWNDVVDFKTLDCRLPPFGTRVKDRVGFDLARRDSWSGTNRRIGGADRELPECNCGLSPVQFAALMNAWREHHHLPGARREG